MEFLKFIICKLKIFLNDIVKEFVIKILIIQEMNFDNKNVKYYFNIFCFYKVGIRKKYNV